MNGRFSMESRDAANGGGQLGWRIGYGERALSTRMVRRLRLVATFLYRLLTAPF